MHVKAKIVGGIIELKFATDGYIVISGINLIKSLAINIKNNQNFIIEASYLLSIFIAEIKYNYPDATFINCNATKDRLNKDIEEADRNNQICIYYNVGKCQHVELLNEIINEQNILIL